MAKYFYHGAEILAPVTIVSNQPVFDVNTVSLKKQRASQGSQRWELSFRVLGTSSTESELFLETVDEISDIHTMIMPQLPSISGNASSVITTIPQTQGANASGDSSIVLDNNSNNSGILKKGNFIKFSNHDKVYVLTNDLNFSSSATSLTANIYPDLQKAVPQNINFLTGATCLLTYCRSVDNLIGLTFTDGILSDMGTINLEESLS